MARQTRKRKQSESFLIEKEQAQFIPPEKLNISPRQRFDEDDALLIFAVKNLKELLASEDRQQWATVIDAPVTVDQQAALWRAKRRACNG